MVRPSLTFTLAILFSVSFIVLAACERNPVKAVEGGVHVDTQNCRENTSAPGATTERAILDCISGGDVTVRIELARTAWDAVRTLDAGANEAARATLLFVDAQHCKENARDSATTENAILDCSLGAQTVIVYLGRQEWRAIKARKTAAPYEAGPGK